MNPKRIAQVAAVCCSVSLLAGYVVYAQRRVNPPAKPAESKAEVTHAQAANPVAEPVGKTEQLRATIAPSSKLMIHVVPKEALTLGEPEKEEVVELPQPKPETFIFSTKSGPVFPAYEPTIQGKEPARGFPVVPAEEKPPTAAPAKTPPTQTVPNQPANPPRSTFAPGSKSIDMLLFSGRDDAPKAPTAPAPPTPQTAPVPATPAALPRITFAPGSKSLVMPVFTDKREKIPLPSPPQQQAPPKGGKQP